MSTAAAAQNPRANSSTLGALWIVYAILRLVAVILLVLYAATATVMFGALLTRVADYQAFMAHLPHSLCRRHHRNGPLRPLRSTRRTSPPRRKIRPHTLSSRRLSLPLRPAPRHNSGHLHPDRFPLNEPPQQFVIPLALRDEGSATRNLRFSPLLCNLYVSATSV